jgi:dipeptidyl aminopeptidase/acylaminoacyl peptidase
MLEFSPRALNPNDLFALRYVHDARLSPDGRHVAYVTSRTVEETAEEFFEITIENRTTGERRELNFTGRALSPRWSPDGARIAFIGGEGKSSRLYVTGANTQETIALTPEGCQVQGPPAWSPDGSTIAYTIVTYRKHEGFHRITGKVFRAEGLGYIDTLVLSIQLVDVHTRVVRPIELGGIVGQQPAFSPGGKHLLFLGTDMAVPFPALGGLKLFTVGLGDGKITEVLGDRWYIASAAWSPCGERIVIAGDYDSTLTIPTIGLWVVNRDGSNPQCRTTGYVGKVGLCIHHDMPTWDTSQYSILSVPDAAQAYATVAKHGCAEIWRIALDGPVHCEPVAAGPRSCLIMDVRADTSQLLYCVSDLNTPWELCLLDLRSGEEKRLTHLNDAVLAGWPALKVEHLTFESADGLPLEGWYLVRADRKGPQPTIMFVHGGPFLATGNAFRYDFHLLAANGYAVLFANFRGSAGYGVPFVRGIMGDWGANGFPDHMAAMDAAIARGLSDPRRLGVWGPSHGGFATCWIVGHTNRFCAAVAESAVTNMLTQYFLCDTPAHLVTDLGGRPDEIPDVYRSRSPLSYAWRCRTPTLMLHGEQDLRCTIAEAEQFYRALHDAGCTTELVRIPGMNHMGDSTGPLSARKGQNEALLDWFERFL